MDIVYRHIEFVTWILSFITLLLSIVTLLLSIVASMLSHVHHHIARPLGPPYDDAEGIDQPLTPADMIYGRQIATSPSDRQFDMMSTAKTLMKRAKYQFRILNTFTKQWQQDYLLDLRERRIVQTRSSDVAPVKEGDTVILKEDDTARALWKLAKIVETVKGRDGLIRAAKVQILSKDKNIHLRRPIQHLIPLEAEV